jgi:hypothetical protein
LEYLNRDSLETVYVDENDCESEFVKGYVLASEEAELKRAKLYRGKWYDLWSDSESDFNKQYVRISEKYVPLVGSSETVYGEIIRAIDTIVYRFYNDGDVFHLGSGVESVFPSVEHLLNQDKLKTLDLRNKYIDKILNMGVYNLHDTYNEFIYVLINWAINNEDENGNRNETEGE